MIAPGSLLSARVRWAMRPNNDPTAPLPIDRLFSQAFSIYRSAFGPYFATATIGALLSTLLTSVSAADPEEPSTWVIPTLLSLLAIVPAAISEAAILAMVLKQRSGERPTVSAAYAASQSMMLRFVGAAALLGLVLAGAVTLTLLVPFLLFAIIPFVLFVVARWSLYGPAIVLDGASAIGALRMSARMVSGRTLRTLGILALLFAASLVAFLFATLFSAMIGGGLGPSIVTGALGLAAVQPFAFITTLLLYEDYQRLAPQPRPAEDVAGGPLGPGAVGESSGEADEVPDSSEPRD